MSCAALAHRHHDRVRRSRLLLTGMAAIVVVVGCARALPVHIPPGVTPRMTSEAVALIVEERVHEMEREAGRVVAPFAITSMDVSARPPEGLVWTVRATGTFAASRPARGAGVEVAGSGTLVIADATGAIIEFGFP